MVEDTEKLIKSYVDSWNSHDVNRIVSYFTEDCVYEDLALGTITNGKKELEHFINGVFVALPDFKIELKSLFFSGSWVGYEWVFTGTQSAPPPGITHPSPPTGVKVSIRGASVAEIHGDKIKRNRDYAIVPPPASLRPDK